VVATAHHQYWYEQATPPPFRQGDIVRDVTAAWLPADFSPERNPVVDTSIADWIVLEASCDLDQGRCAQVLLARVIEANAVNLKTNDAKSLNERLELIRRGGYVTRFMLAEHPHSKLPLSFVEFNTRVMLPHEYLKRVSAASGVLRLKSPFREQLGNWVGSCFSRVGPENETLIPAFTKLHDAHRLKALDDQ
jgi:hypothetical protein